MTQSQYKLVGLNPAWVHGPGVKASASNESYAFVKLLGDGAIESGCPNLGIWVVDVRDVAKAHAAAAFTEEAEGRFIVSGHNTYFPEIAKAISTKYPEYRLPNSIVAWPIVFLLSPFIGLNRRMVWRGANVEPNIDNCKSISDLKMEYTSMDSTFQEKFAQMIDSGIVKKPTKTTK